MIKKYSGAGNRFFMVNNLTFEITDYKKNVAELINTDNSMDGVIYLENSDNADFKMNYFNKDGTGNALCGNGLRCTFKFIKDLKLSDRNELCIEAVSETYKCKLLDRGEISVKFPPPAMMKTNFKLKVHFQDWWELLNCSYVDVGSPHIIVFINEIEKPVVKSIDEVNIPEWGRNIRMHKDLMPEGANVNFIQITSLENAELAIRSYERGVEGETLACGTGALSSALVFYILKNQKTPVKLLTKSGEYLTVDLEISDNKINSIYLSGKAESI